MPFLQTGDDPLAGLINPEAPDPLAGLNGPQARDPLSGLNPYASPVPRSSTAGELTVSFGDNEFTKGLRRGGLGIEGTTRAFGAQLAEPASQQEADKMFAQANKVLDFGEGLRPKVATWDDVHDPSSFLQYGLGKAGEAVPSSALSMGAAGLGAAASLGLRALTRGRVNLPLGFLAGSGSMLPQEAGEQALAMHNDPAAMANTTPWERLGLSTAKGGINAALEFTPEALAINRAFGAPRVGRGLFPALGAVGKGIGEAAAGEAITEGLQEKTGQIFQGIANPQRDTAGDTEAIREAMLGGAFGGVGLGAMSGGVHALRSQIPEMPDMPQFRMPEVPELNYETGHELGANIGDAILKAKHNVVDYISNLGSSVNQNLKPSREMTEGMKMDLALLRNDPDIKQRLAEIGASEMEQNAAVQVLHAFRDVPTMANTPAGRAALKDASIIFGKPINTLLYHIQEKGPGVEGEDLEPGGVAHTKFRSPESAMEDAIFNQKRQTETERQEAESNYNFESNLDRGQFESSAQDELVDETDYAANADDEDIDWRKKEAPAEIEKLFGRDSLPVDQSTLEAAVQDLKYFHPEVKHGETRTNEMALHLSSDTISPQDLMRLFTVKDTSKKEQARKYTEQEIKWHTRDGKAELYISPMSLANAMSTTHGDQLGTLKEGQTGRSGSRKGDIAMAALATMMKDGVTVVDEAGNEHHVNVDISPEAKVVKTIKGKISGTERKEISLPNELLINKEAGGPGYTVGDYKKDMKDVFNPKTKEELGIERELLDKFMPLAGNDRAWAAALKEEKKGPAKYGTVRGKLLYQIDKNKDDLGKTLGYHVRNTAYDTMRQVKAHVENIIDNKESYEGNPQDLVEALQEYFGSDGKNASTTVKSFFKNTGLQLLNEATLKSDAMKNDKNMRPHDYLLKDLEWLHKKAKGGQVQGVLSQDEAFDLLENPEINAEIGGIGNNFWDKNEKIRPVKWWSGVFSKPVLPSVKAKMVRGLEAYLQRLETQGKWRIEGLQGNKFGYFHSKHEAQRFIDQIPESGYRLAVGGKTYTLKEAAEKWPNWREQVYQKEQAAEGSDLEEGDEDRSIVDASIVNPETGEVLAIGERDLRHMRPAEAVRALDKINKAIENTSKLSVVDATPIVTNDETMPVELAKLLHEQQNRGKLKLSTPIEAEEGTKLAQLLKDKGITDVGSLRKAYAGVPRVLTPTEFASFIQTVPEKREKAVFKKDAGELVRAETNVEAKPGLEKLGMGEEERTRTFEKGADLGVKLGTKDELDDLRETISELLQRKNLPDENVRDLHKFRAEEEALLAKLPGEAIQAITVQISNIMTSKQISEADQVRLYHLRSALAEIIKQAPRRVEKLKPGETNKQRALKGKMTFGQWKRNWLMNQSQHDERMAAREKKLKEQDRDVRIRESGVFHEKGDIQANVTYRGGLGKEREDTFVDRDGEQWLISSTEDIARGRPALTRPNVAPNEALTTKPSTRATTEEEELDIADTLESYTKHFERFDKIKRGEEEMTPAEIAEAEKHQAELKAERDAEDARLKETYDKQQAKYFANYERAEKAAKLEMEKRKSEVAQQVSPPVKAPATPLSSIVKKGKTHVSQTPTKIKPSATKKELDAAKAEGEEARLKFLKLIRDKGGISVREAIEIAREKANKLGVGTFSRKGDALDLIIRALVDAKYMTQADIDDDPQGGYYKARELINDALNKEVVAPLDEKGEIEGRIEAAQAAWEAEGKPETDTEAAAESTVTAENRTVTQLDSHTRVTRQDIKNDPNTIYVYGDNWERSGLGGAAAVARGEPNAYGVATKRAPYRTEAAYLSDVDYKKNTEIMDADFAKIPKDKNVVLFPLGTNLAQLEARAKHTWDYLQYKIKELKGEKVTPPPGPPAATPAAPTVATPRSPRIIQMYYKDGTYNHTMRREFRGKSTLDLIKSGDRTASTRAAKPDYKVGEILRATGEAGDFVDIRVTKAPYPVTDVTREEWSKLEGWAEKDYSRYANRNAWQFQYERADKPAAPAQPAKPAVTEPRRLDIHTDFSKTRYYQLQKWKQEGMTDRQIEARIAAAKGKDAQLVREPENKHDPNAVKVMVGDVQHGYVPADVARKLAPNLDAGVEVRAYFDEDNRLHLETKPKGFTRQSLQSEDFHRELGRPGFAATHDSPIRHEGKFNWRAHIGKGQGAASFGAGTYLSTAEGVHKSYKEEFTQLIAGYQADRSEEFNSFFERFLEDPNAPLTLGLKRALVKHLVREVKEMQERLNKLNAIIDDRDNQTMHAVHRASMEADIVDIDLDGRKDLLKYIQTAEIGKPISKRTPSLSKTSPTYHVSVDIDPNHLLDWDKPFSRQSKFVQKALEKEGFKPISTFEPEWEMQYAEPINEPQEEDEFTRYKETWKAEGENSNHIGYIHETNNGKWEATEYLPYGPEGSTNFETHEKTYDTRKEAEEALKPFLQEGLTGEDIYRRIQEKFRKGVNGEKAQAMTSDALQKAGILGHRYNSSGSTNAKFPNYVIYDDSKIHNNAVTFSNQAQTTPGFNPQRTTRATMLHQIQQLAQVMFGKKVEVIMGAPPGGWGGARGAYTSIRSQLDALKANEAELKKVRNQRRIAQDANDTAEVAKLDAREASLLKQEEVLGTIYLNPTLAVREMLPTYYHEAVHAAFDILLTQEERAILATAFSKGTVRRQLEKIFANDAAVLKQLEDAEEGAAYGFQIYSAAPHMIQLGPKVDSIFAKVAKWFKNMLGILSPEQKAMVIMNDMLAGKLADKGLSPLVRELDKDMTLKQKVAKHATVAAKMIGKLWEVVASPSYDRLIATNIPSLVQFAKLGHTKTGEKGDLGMIQRLQNTISSNFNWVDKIAKKYTLDELRAVSEHRMRGTAPTEPKLIQAYKDVDAFFNEFRKYAKDAGVDLGFIKNYWPMLWDAEAVMKGRDEFLKMISQPKYAKELAKLKVTPTELWENISGYVTRGDSFQNIIGPSGEPVNAYSKERSLSFLDADDRKPFMKDNPLETMVNYVSHMVRQAEYVRKYGENGKIRDAILKEAELKYGATPAQITLAKDYLDGLLGNKEVGMSRELKDLYGVAVVYQNYRLLPFNLFTSLVDPLGIAIRSGRIGDALEAFTYSLKNIFRDIRKAKEYADKDQWEKLAIDWGHIEDAGVMSNLRHMMETTELRGFSKTMNDALFKWNLLNGWTRSTKIMAVKAGQRFIARSAKGTDKHSIRHLEELGLKPSDVIETQEGNIAMRKDEFMAQGMSETQAEKAEARMRDAMTKFVNQAILNPTAADLPNWGSNPYLAPIFHLKQFMFTFQTTIMSRIYQEAKEGNLKPLWISGIYIPGMIAADAMRGFVSNMGDQPPWQKDWGPADYVKNGVSRSGLLGSGQMFASMQDDVMHGGKGYESAVGPTVEQFMKGLQAASKGDTTLWNFIVKAMPLAPVYDQWLLSNKTGPMAKSF